MSRYDNLTLKIWLDENKDFIKGARIQKIQQPNRRELILTLRNYGISKKLYININPQFYHICFMSKDNEAKRLLNIPKSPPMFCMLLRKYMENARISGVNQPEYERIIEFYIESYNELSEKIYLCLAVELMGKHSNIILYNFDNNIILGCAHNIGSEKSREREMAGGLPYVYPPKSMQMWYCAQNSFSECKTDINTCIDDFYAKYISDYKFKQLKNLYIQKTDKKLSKELNTASKIEKQLKDYKLSEKYRHYADLIMSNLYHLKDFSSEAEVYDYDNEAQIKIELDENKTLKENANTFYKLYNKAKKSNQSLNEILNKKQAEIIYLKELLFSVTNTENMEDLTLLKDEIESDLTHFEPQKSSVIPTKLEIGGYYVFVGKNNKQNDYIVTRLAKDEDLWFHVLGCAGSHVLLRGKNPPENIIYECAKLAGENSSAKNTNKISVIYTSAKYLKKPPASKLGYVTYKNEKEIIVEL